MDLPPPAPAPAAVSGRKQLLSAVIFTAVALGVLAGLAFLAQVASAGAAGGCGGG
jgi:hypothetical protein